MELEKQKVITEKMDAALAALRGQSIEDFVNQVPAQ
jgi:hypothetical protein